MKWINIVEQQNLKPRKTKVFCVFTQYHASTECLGEIRWHGPWRKYCFFPTGNTLFEWVCLRDIADFCQQETKRYKELWPK
jgi:hypothetical protein